MQIKWLQSHGHQTLLNFSTKSKSHRTGKWDTKYQHFRIRYIHKINTHQLMLRFTRDNIDTWKCLLNDVKVHLNRNNHLNMSNKLNYFVVHFNRNHPGWKNFNWRCRWLCGGVKEKPQRPSWWVYEGCSIVKSNFQLFTSEIKSWWHTHHYSGKNSCFVPI